MAGGKTRLFRTPASPAGTGATLDPSRRGWFAGAAVVLLVVGLSLKVGLAGILAPPDGDVDEANQSPPAHKAIPPPLSALAAAAKLRGLYHIGDGYLVGAKYDMKSGLDLRLQMDPAVGIGAPPESDPRPVGVAARPDSSLQLFGRYRPVAKTLQIGQRFEIQPAVRHAIAEPIAVWSDFDLLVHVYLGTHDSDTFRIPADVTHCLIFGMGGLDTVQVPAEPGRNGRPVHVVVTDENGQPAVFNRIEWLSEGADFPHPEEPMRE